MRKPTREKREGWSFSAGNVPGKRRNVIPTGTISRGTIRRIMKVVPYILEP